MSLHWLPMKYRCEYKLLMYVFKAINSDAPTYLQELVNMYRPGRTLRSENSMFLQVPKNFRTKTYGNRRFDCAAPFLWNNLPMTLRKLTSLDAFKRDLKTHLFRKAYCDI